MRALSFWRSFSRSQVASVAATLVDFGLLVLLVEGWGLWYVLATGVGALAGAVTNFLMNRHWSFDAGASSWTGQAFRYSLVSGGSLVLNVAGVYLVTEGWGSPYPASKLVTALLVGWFFNYPLHRGFVFPAKVS